LNKRSVKSRCEGKTEYYKARVKLILDKINFNRERNAYKNHFLSI